ncbi:hypothetical protein BDZ45DRAFT_403880 [Acephala macrosclerotiorum]|nr:hypothetical protein BDZ45DRAFT_403880 [Acephala macrosclerotiorum]
MRCAANGKGSDSCHLTCGSFLLSRFRFEAYHVILSFQLEPRGKLRVHHYLFFQMLISHPCFLHGSLRNLHRLPSIPTTDPSPRIASMIPNPTSFPSLHSIQPQHNPNTTPPPRTRIRIPTFVAFVALPIPLLATFLYPNPSIRLTSSARRLSLGPFLPFSPFNWLLEAF